MQSSENIDRHFFRWRKIDNSNGVFLIQIEYIGRDEVIDVIKFGSDSVRNFSSDSQTNTTQIIWTMLIIDKWPHRWNVAQ